MDSEELEDLEIKKNEDLNEDAEYTGNKQDLEMMLLDAQRYLNIFHQIHIFSSKKKAEFEQSLIDMPERIRAVLLNLPGGRVLNEYIEDCEIKRGLREARTEFVGDDPFLKNEKEIQQTSAINKEFAQSLKDVMETYNANLLQMNEKILQNSKLINDTERNTNSQTKALIEALRENNKHQVEMLKTLGSTLSQAILSAKTEEKQIVEALIKREEANTDKLNNSNNSPKEKSDTATNKETKKNENVKKSTPEPKESDVDINEIPVLHKFNSSAPTEKNDMIDDSGTEEIRQAISKNKAENKTNEKSGEVSDIDIASLLGDDTETKIKEPKLEIPQKNPLALDSATLLKETKQNSQDAKQNEKGTKQSNQETTKEKTPLFGNAMQKIKNAITETANISLDKIKEAPISLGDIKDDLTDSFSKAFTSKKEEPAQVAESEEWEYVDENGNPINPEEWEYVDENGNPVNPEEWEYVDENGNPVNPEEWEYVDENGNPISK